MRVFRISNHSTLDGEGGLYASGRWHTKGRRIVYTAMSPSGAALEMIAHFDLPADLLPATWRYLVIEIPDPIVDAATKAPPHLPDPDDLAASRRIGDLWLSGQRSALMIVRSVLAPDMNVLINPEHPEARECRIVEELAYRVDPRLFGMRAPTPPENDGADPAHDATPSRR